MNKPHIIAVIEDELPICTMYELKLKNNGYQVATATNREDVFNMWCHNTLSVTERKKVR